ncbi:MAG TPA: pitrilysin family protein [Candidatus Udaeobacter sp.]|nr:pitrilysin family protein [Candidatus Udaeobacter sp.]
MRTSHSALRHALLVVLAGIGLSAGSAGAQTIQIPKSTAYKLPNGLQVTLVEQHAAPLVEVRMRIPAGIVHEPEGKEGLARFTGELLTQGTAKHSATEFAAALDQIGAQLGANAVQDFLAVSLSTLARHSGTALDLLAECVQQPAFADAEIERTRQRLLAGVQQQGEDPAELAEVAFWQASFAGDPYGRRADGGEASLTAITPAEIRAFHQQHVIPTGSVLVAVGDFQTSAMKSEIDRRFGAWKGGAAAPAPAPAAMSKGGFVLVNKPALTQSQIQIGYPGLPRGHQDEAPLQVTTTVLGGGFTSRLLEALRVERSLVYTVAFQSLQQGRAGVARVVTGTKTPTTRQALAVTLSEIDRFRTEGPKEDELAKVKNYLSGSIARSLQSPADIAQSLSSAAYYGLPPDYLAQRVARIRAVTVADVKRVSQEHLIDGERTIVLVADAAAVRDSLGAFGKPRETSFESLLK